MASFYRLATNSANVTSAVIFKLNQTSNNNSKKIINCLYLSKKSITTTRKLALGGGLSSYATHNNKGLFPTATLLACLQRPQPSVAYSPSLSRRQYSGVAGSSALRPLGVTRFVHQSNMADTLRNQRYISTREITKNMTLYTSEEFKGEVDKQTLEFKAPSGNPLVLLMSWLLAKQNHLKKYAQIYTEMGFDVMVVHVTPWQLLWPVKGTQVVAAETLKFLENNKSYAPIVVHGFSVGAYQFGEIMLQMAKNMDRYKQVLDRFACQIWDSAADITEIPVGLPKSIFPKNLRMQSALRNYTLYHLKTFHNQATIHYMRSSQMFHSTILKKPALIFVSENDLIGPPSSNSVVRDNWVRANIDVTMKIWEKSAHAAHYIKHRDEYLEYLYKHLESAGVLQAKQQGLKTRAKL